MRRIATCFLFFLACSCTRTTTFERGKYLLGSQNVRGNRTVESDELLALLPQKPNRTFIFNPVTPFLWVYFTTKPTFEQKKKPAFEAELRELLNEKDRSLVNLDPSDFVARSKVLERFEKKEAKLKNAIENGHWWMRVMGEKPSLITREEAQINDSTLQLYLRQNKGFLDARVSYAFDTVAFSRVKITYNINEGRPYLINEVKLQTNNTRIDSILRENRSGRLLKRGLRFGEANANAERERIEKVLRDNGYYNFSRQSITIQGSYDSNLDFPASHQLDITLSIDSTQKYVNYSIGTVTLFVDAPLPEEASPKLDTVHYQGIKYVFSGKKYPSNLLFSKIRLKPGEFYSQSKQNETLRLVGTLDQFKYPNISFDTTGQGRLNALLIAEPLKKYEVSSEAGLNVFQGLPGPFLNGSLRIRNFLKGLEMLEIAGKVGYDGQPGYTEGANNLKFRDQNFEAGINTSVIFPQLLFFGKRGFAFSNPRTQIGVGYNYSDRRDFRRSGLKFAYNYFWQLSDHETFTFTPFDVNIINTNRKSDAFVRFLDDQFALGVNLRATFAQSFISSMSAAYSYNDNRLAEGKQGKFFRIFVESGGTTLNLLSKDREFQLMGDGKGLQHYKFLKTSIDARNYRPINSTTVLVLRTNIGLAWEYSSNGVLPYEKAFFVGGANSMRGWRPRKLGLGASVVKFDTTSTGTLIPNYDQERPGDMMIELNAELRFRIFKFYGDFNGAIFLDAGNVWTTNRQADETDGFFRLNSFVPQTALNTGFGIRFDKSFFILRADWGIKLYEPGRPRADGSRGQWVLGDLWKPNLGYRPELRFGIGYPF